MKNPAQRRYNRIAWLYDLMEAPVEKGRFQHWRTELFERLPVGDVLEVGVGTGKNLPYYPKTARVTAIDISEKMLARAAKKTSPAKVHLEQMDIEELRFPDGTFDAVLGTFVFCSVPDPVRGLAEIRRVLKPDGKLLLLEHVRPEGRLGTLFDLLNPIVAHVVGANVNRETEANIRRAGFTRLSVERLSRIFRRFEAQP